MGRELLRDLLMLRGNSEIVVKLTTEAANEKRQALLDARTASTKRNHDAKVAGATAAVQAAAKRARPEIDISDEGGLVDEFGEAAVEE